MAGVNATQTDTEHTNNVLLCSLFTIKLVLKFCEAFYTAVFITYITKIFFIQQILIAWQLVTACQKVLRAGISCTVQFIYGRQNQKSEGNLLIASCTIICDRCKVYHFGT